MSDITENLKKTFLVLKSEGPSSVAKHVKHYLKYTKESKKIQDCNKDILFINGCPRESLPHPPRYRVTNQKEQLETNGYTCDEIFYKNIHNDLVYKYRGFIIFRCVYTEQMEEFISLAKSFNKPVFYDIDDLVFDTKYTDQISYVQKMNKENRLRYDKDVKKYGKLLSLCDCGITTTEALSKEMKNYIPNVIVNRNSASLELVSISNKTEKKEQATINIGYFSGSITHNPDFEMILPVIIKILSRNDNVILHIAGELDIPSDLEKYKNQIIIHPFVDWKELPSLIAQMDINLAPLEESIFNEAKSEIKWMEASLVKVCTVASNFGAFKKCIEDNKNGFLCSNLDDWENILLDLIKNKEKRQLIAKNAYDYCLKNYVTINNGMSFIRKLEKYIPKNITFCVAKMELSGGILIVLKHACILQDYGYDVSILSLYDDMKSYNYQNHTFPVLPLENDKHTETIDIAVASMWSTVPLMEEFNNVKSKYYLVQNFETGFYDYDDVLKIKSNITYNSKSSIKYLTISKWCQNWLKNHYGKECTYIPNGIYSSEFYPVERDWNEKIRILIEGDCGAAHKNVDEAFEITNKLDPSKFEVWYMSYNAKPKDWYHIDKFFHKVSHEKVPEIYRECHILLKTSLLESFSYPPLEMMATGGMVVALANEGNVEYLKDEYNCLFYENGNIEEGIRSINRIVEDSTLREILFRNGIQTAKDRDWSKIKDDVIKNYV